MNEKTINFLIKFWRQKNQQKRLLQQQKAILYRRYRYQ